MSQQFGREGILSGIVNDLSENPAEQIASSILPVELQDQVKAEVFDDKSATAVIEGMTGDQLRQLIKNANDYNPGNVETPETVSNFITIYSGPTFSPPPAVSIGLGNGNKAYIGLMSKKIREGMGDVRVLDCLSKNRKTGGHPRHVLATAKLLLALSAISRSVKVHGAEGMDIRWRGEKTPRSIDVPQCVLAVVQENLQLLYQMSSYWLPARGLTEPMMRDMGFMVMPPSPAKSVKEEETATA